MCAYPIKLRCVVLCCIVWVSVVLCEMLLQAAVVGDRTKSVGCVSVTTSFPVMVFDGSVVVFGGAGFSGGLAYQSLVSCRAAVRVGVGFWRAAVRLCDSMEWHLGSTTATNKF